MKETNDARVFVVFDNPSRLMPTMRCLSWCCPCHARSGLRPRLRSSTLFTSFWKANELLVVKLGALSFVHVLRFTMSICHSLHQHSTRQATTMHTCSSITTPCCLRSVLFVSVPCELAPASTIDTSAGKLSQLYCTMTIFSTKEISRLERDISGWTTSFGPWVLHTFQNKPPIIVVTCAGAWNLQSLIFPSHGSSGEIQPRTKTGVGVRAMHCLCWCFWL